MLDREELMSKLEDLKNNTSLYSFEEIQEIASAALETIRKDIGLYYALEQSNNVNEYLYSQVRQLLGVE